MISWFAVATLVSTESAVSQGWCTPVGCVPSSLVSQALLVVGALALVCFALGALSFIPEARAVVREEHERAAAERDAFERFRRRVASLDATSARTPSAGGTNTLGAGALAVSGTRDDRLGRVRDAYRTTVTDVDHYDDEYGEPLEANLAAEFGDGVAGALAGGDTFTPALRSTLLEEASEASERRARLCRALDCEAETVRDAASTLREVEALVETDGTPTLGDSYETLDARWQRLYDAKQTVESLLNEQQETVRRNYGVAPGIGERIGLHEYLYDAEPYTHPVLAEGAALLDSLHEAQDRTAVALSRRI
jgi:hypothetical protein